MRHYRLSIALGALLLVNVCHAVPITSLRVLTAPIKVGDSFAVEVYLDNDQVGEELLAFAFNVLPLSSQLGFNGFVLNPLLTDVSDPLNSLNVAGLAFPGIADNAVWLATLEFSALSAGTTSIGIEGLLDPGNPLDLSGLFYQFSATDIAAQTQVDVLDRQFGVPEPACLALFAMPLLLLLFQRKGLFLISRAT